MTADLLWSMPCNLRTHVDKHIMQVIVGIDANWARMSPTQRERHRTHGHHCSCAESRNCWSCCNPTHGHQAGVIHRQGETVRRLVKVKINRLQSWADSPPVVLARLSVCFSHSAWVWSVSACFPATGVVDVNVKGIWIDFPCCVRSMLLWTYDLKVIFFFYSLEISVVYTSSLPADGVSIITKYLSAWGDLQVMPGVWWIILMQFILLLILAS